MPNPFVAGKRAVRRTITGAVTGLQPFRALFVTRPELVKDAIDFLTVNAVMAGPGG
jgi:hypothetical protein